MIKVYIASPYTKGDVAVNVRTQLETANKLMNWGFAPFAPLYSHFQHMAFPRPYEDWIKIDLEWVKVCDAVLRLPGESNGADGEVFFAQQNNIPVFYSIWELCKHFGLVTENQTEGPQGQIGPQSDRSGGDIGNGYLSW